MDPQAISTGSQALMTMFVVGAGVIGMPGAIKVWRRGFRLRGLFLATFAVAVGLAAVRISLPYLLLAASDAVKL